MDFMLTDDTALGVTMYGLLFALLVFGGVAIHLGYKAFGIVLLCGTAVLLIALVTGRFVGG